MLIGRGERKWAWWWQLMDMFRRLLNAKLIGTDRTFISTFLLDTSHMTAHRSWLWSSDTRPMSWSSNEANPRSIRAVLSHFLRFSALAPPESRLKRHQHKTHVTPHHVTPFISRLRSFAMEILWFLWTSWQLNWHRLSLLFIFLFIYLFIFSHTLNRIELKYVFIHSSHSFIPSFIHLLNSLNKLD